MPITTVEKDKSVKFIDIIHELLEFVELAAPHLPEIEYLNACNKLKTLNELGAGTTTNVYITQMVERVRENPEVRRHIARTRMKEIDRHTIKTDAWKLKNGWKCCPKCDRIVVDINSHKFTDVCKRTNDSKKVSATSSTVNTDREMTFIHSLRAWRIKYDKART